MVWWSITTNEPGHVSSSWALNLYRLSKLLFQGPYNLSNARFLPFHTLLYGIKILYSSFSLFWSSVALTVASSLNQSITYSQTQNYVTPLHTLDLLLLLQVWGYGFFFTCKWHKNEILISENNWQIKKAYKFKTNRLP